MRAVVALIVAASGVFLPASLLVAGESCATLRLDSPKDRSALIERVARGNADALKQAQTGRGCFAGMGATAVATAAGDYFDSKPREFLETVFAVGVEPFEFLESLTVPPARLEGDVRAEMALLVKRVAAIDTNADLFSPRAHEVAGLIFRSAVNRRMSPFVDRFPEPETFVHPLLGVEVEVQGGAFQPIPVDYHTLADQARIAHDRAIVSLTTDGYRTKYLALVGFAFAYSKGAAEPTGIEPFEPRIQRIDESRPREVIEDLGPASEMFSNARIPPKLLAELADRVVYQATRMFPPGIGLQPVLDERIAREPGAGFPKPLRDALLRAGLDVSKYREIAVAP